MVTTEKISYTKEFFSYMKKINHSYREKNLIGKMQLPSTLKIKPSLYFELENEYIAHIEIL